MMTSSLPQNKLYNSLIRTLV